MNKKQVYFAGGCFWCMEMPFVLTPGVEEVYSGYTGGHVENPTYEQVCTGATGHFEAVKVVYDADALPFEDLLAVFYTSMDPTDPYGQFADRGEQYFSAIFYQDEEQRNKASRFAKLLNDSGIFDAPVDVKILPAGVFYNAEEYHQHYYDKNKQHYQSYKKASGREPFLKRTWTQENHAKLSAILRQLKVEFNKQQLVESLSPAQYHVTQKEGTDAPHQGEFDQEFRDGIYVDIVSGEPLFSSKDKYDAGCGWPSFSRPIEQTKLVEKSDHKLLMKRTEVRSPLADSHLGHVFTDGPAQAGGLRYCINSSSLRFIPADQLEQEGYPEFKKLFEE